MIKFKNIALTLIAFFAVFAIFAPSTSAANDPCHPELATYNNVKIGGAKLTPEQLKSCEACKKAGLKPGEAGTCLQQNIIVKRLNEIVNILTGIVSLVVIGVVIVGGIQYSLAGGNPQAAANARKRITNGLLALFAFLLTWAFLQWLIPGGI